MKPTRRLLPLLLLAFFPVVAGAQPMAQTLWTLEAKIAQAENVIIGTIEQAKLHVVVPLGAREKDGYLADVNGRSFNTFSIKVEEVLKGNLKGVVEGFDTLESLGFDRRYEEWAKAKTKILWYIGPLPKPGWRRAWEAVPLGPRVPAEDWYGGRSSGPPMMLADFSMLKTEEVFLARARAYAKTSTKVLPTQIFRIPAKIGERTLGGSLDYLVVPVEPALEERAKKLLSSPEDFVPKDGKLEPADRLLLRYAGLTSLSHFRSDSNIAIVRKLLEEPTSKIKVGFGGVRDLHSKAVEILLQWGAELPAGNAEAAIRSLEVSALSDDSVKQLAKLSSLSTLRLRGAQVSPTTLRGLAGLKNLTSLHLDPAQITDANVKALREAGLLHTLSLADTEDRERPRSPADITQLDLHFVPLTDVGLKEFADFTNLKTLLLNGSQVQGEAFKELAGFRKLTILQMVDAPVTDAGLKEIARLPSLVRLRIGGSKITDVGLKELAGHANLVHLDLSRTKITAAGLVQVAAIKNLVNLELSGDQLSDESLRALREHELFGLLSQAWDAKRRRSNDEVSSFGLMDTQVTDAGLKELVGLKNLKQLHLQTPKVTGVGFKHLTGLKNLTDISVRKTPLTEDGLGELANLKSLRTLHMHGPDVTDERLRVLVKTGMLHVLYDASSSTKFPGGTFPPRAKSDDAVRYLDLSYTDVTDAGMKELARLKNLAVLNVIGTKVTSAGLKELAGLQGMQRLGLGGAQVNDAALKEATAFKNLTRVMIRYAPITDDGLMELASLKQLTSVFLDHTNVSKSGMARLQKALPACKIEP